MDLGAAGLNEQPFRTHGRPLSIIPYASHDESLAALDATCATRNGLMLMQGPPLSGKTTLIRQFVDTLPADRSVAIVDGNGLNTTGLLESVLRQYGYVIEHNSNNELLGMLRVFALHQCAAEAPPILIIENTHSLNPSALRVLCELARLEVRGFAALKIVLCSDRSLHPLVESPSMECIAGRVSCDQHLRPMSAGEATRYLHGKLRAAGSQEPGRLFPEAVCADLWNAAGGWPGILDRLALLCLARATALPVGSANIERPLVPRGTWVDAPASAPEAPLQTRPEPPVLFVTRDGETLCRHAFTQDRLLLGRSEHNDVEIPSKFVSRHHALLVRQGSATFLMDLNSTNGTYVNSRRVSNHVLVHDDVITLGHYRVKFHDPHATTRGSLDSIDFADTAVMKTLDDMRRLLAQENTEILPTVTENLPTAGAQP
jgi:type II secretory pathway predicted ATPase ExeA